MRSIDNRRKEEHWAMSLKCKSLKKSLEVRLMTFYGKCTAFVRSNNCSLRTDIDPTYQVQ